MDRPGCINVDHAIAGGDRLVGYKLGNIAKVMQEAFGLGQPDYPARRRADDPRTGTASRGHRVGIEVAAAGP
ncbi:2-oxo-hepta-3-ene-1,7-dioic acid hydratase [Rhodococcus sp. WAY2]|nr:2-oxo-hepta-3-ene-1,7-dioic acid hydratase [Rhodococcus sp. WAY2]